MYVSCLAPIECYQAPTTMSVNSVMCSIRKNVSGLGGLDNVAVSWQDHRGNRAFTQKHNKI